MKYADYICVLFFTFIYTNELKTNKFKRKSFDQEIHLNFHLFINFRNYIPT